VGHGPGDQRLAAAGRPVQEHALGRVDAEPLEHLRVPQGQLDDLPDPLDLAFQPADVLVGDGPRLFFLVGPLYFQGRGRVDRHGPRGPRADDLEVRRTRAEKRRADAVALDDRQPVQKAADVSQVPVARRHPDGREDHARRRPGGDLTHLDRLVETRAGVLPGQSVDLHPRLAAQVLVGRHDLADSRPLADDLDGVADLDLQPGHVGGVKPRQAAAHVLAQCFGDFQFQRCPDGLSHGAAFPCLTWSISP
jgi:hypothetical protein